MQLPAPLRAAVGLAAAVADEARHLPDRAIELPMLAVSTALQMSLRAQQRYAALTARGDEILGGSPTDAPPPWATFDDPLDPDELRRLAGEATNRDASAVLEEIFGSFDPLPAPSAEDDRSPIEESTDADPELPPPTPIRPKAAKKKAPRPAGKSVSKPRHVKPSKFDDAGDVDDSAD